MKEREGNFEHELKVSSFELLVNFLNSIQLWLKRIHALFGKLPSFETFLVSDLSNGPGKV